MTGKTDDDEAIRTPASDAQCIEWIMSYSDALIDLCGGNYKRAQAVYLYGAVKGRVPEQRLLDWLKEHTGFVRKDREQIARYGSPFWGCDILPNRDNPDMCFYRDKLNYNY